MRMNVYAIYDVKADAFMQPLFMVNDDVAIRNFVGACLNPDTPFHLHGQDFTLFCIDEWDDGKGKFVGDALHRDLGNGLQLMIQFRDQIEKVQQLQTQIGKLTDSQQIPGSNGAELNA